MCDSQFTTSYIAVFGPVAVECDVFYSVEPDEPRDSLLVESVKIGQIVVSGPRMRQDEQRFGIWLDGDAPGMEALAEAWADKIAIIRKEAIFAACVADYETFHTPKRK